MDDREAERFDLAAWVFTRLAGERQGAADTVDSELEDVYGFDPRVFERVIEAMDIAVDAMDMEPDDEEAKKAKAWAMFELGYAWRARTQERFEQAMGMGA